MPETTTAKKAPARKAASSPQEAQDAPRSVWDRLAEPFPQEDLERLPKPLFRDDRDKGRCEDTPKGRAYTADGHFCGGWHSRSVHLTYVGHAGITTRLNQVLTPAGWDFQPLAFTPEGLPLMARGEFWGVLSVKDPETGEVTRKSDLAANFNSTQEAWGDALRRCAMRFGVGTYLWAKSETAHAKAQHSEPAPDAVAASDAQRQQQAAEPEPQAPPVQQNQTGLRPDQQILADRLAHYGPEPTAAIREWWADQSLPFLRDLDTYGVQAVMSYLDEREADPTANPQ